jgi:hypothetical protein
VGGRWGLNWGWAGVQRLDGPGKGAQLLLPAPTLAAVLRTPCLYNSGIITEHPPSAAFSRSRSLPGLPARRDIKPQNLLVNINTHALKLCDFGSAKALVRGEPNISYICSRYYRAPELIFGATDYTCAIDVSTVCYRGGGLELGALAAALRSAAARLVLPRGRVHPPHPTRPITCLSPPPCPPLPACPFLSRRCGAWGA